MGTEPDFSSGGVKQSTGMPLKKAAVPPFQTMEKLFCKLTLVISFGLEMGVCSSSKGSAPLPLLPFHFEELIHARASTQIGFNEQRL